MKTLIDLAYDDIAFNGVVSDKTIALAVKMRRTEELQAFCRGASAILEYLRKPQRLDDNMATRGGRV